MKLYHPYKTEKTIAMADQNKIRKKILNQLLVQNDNNIDFFPQLSMFFFKTLELELLEIFDYS